MRIRRFDASSRSGMEAGREAEPEEQTDVTTLDPEAHPFVLVRTRAARHADSPRSRRFDA